MRRFIALLTFFIFLGLQVSLPLVWADSQIEQARRHILMQTGRAQEYYDVARHGALPPGSGFLESYKILLSSEPIIIGKYAPWLRQGRIYVAYFHNFLSLKSFCLWAKKNKVVADSTTSSICAREGIKVPKRRDGHIASLIPEKDGRYLGKAALMLIVTPDKVDQYDPVTHTYKNRYLDPFYKGVDYDALTFCSAAKKKEKVPKCDKWSLKALDLTAFMLSMAEVGKMYKAPWGFVAVAHGHVKKKKKKSGTIRKKVCIELYWKMSPRYWTMVSQDVVGVGNFCANEYCFLRVAKKDSKGFNFSADEERFYKKCKSGWAPIVVFAFNVFSTILSYALTGQPFLSKALWGSLFTKIAQSHTLFSTLFDVAGWANLIASSTYSVAAQSYRDYTYNPYGYADFHLSADERKIFKKLVNEVLFPKFLKIPLGKEMAGIGPTIRRSRTDRWGVGGEIIVPGAESLREKENPELLRWIEEMNR